MIGNAGDAPPTQRRARGTKVEPSAALLFRCDRQDHLAWPSDLVSTSRSFGTSGVALPPGRPFGPTSDVPTQPGRAWRLLPVPLIKPGRQCPVPQIRCRKPRYLRVSCFDRLSMRQPSRMAQFSLTLSLSKGEGTASNRLDQPQSSSMNLRDRTLVVLRLLATFRRPKRIEERLEDW